MNTTLLEEGKGGYESAIFEDLIQRFEEPEGRNRWDSPLFTVPYEDETLPLEAIWDAMIGEDGRGSGRVKKHAATILVSISLFSTVTDHERALFLARQGYCRLRVRYSDGSTRYNL